MNNRPRRDLATKASLAVLTLVLGSSVAFAVEETSYPIVFGSSQELRELGIALGASLPNECYYYGDGGYSLSLSGGFLERYRKRGFSLNSLCMALVSGIRFDPETGDRLPTYVVADLDALGDPERSEEVGVVTDELPLAVPQCFSRGLPYSDCVFKFDPRSGRRLEAAEVERIRRTGASVEARFEEALAAGKYGPECPCERIDESCRRERWGRCLGGDLESAALAPEEHSLEGFDDIGFYDVSAALPKGFGYALYAEGGAGPAADPAVVRAARDGKKRATEARIKRIKVLLESAEAPRRR